MRWDEIIEAAEALVLADDLLEPIFGGAVYLGGSRGLEVPSLEVRLIADSEDEQWGDVILQWDIWTQSLADRVAAERRLRRLFHHDIPTVLGGFGCFSMYDGGEDTASPDRDGHFGRAIRFRMSALRERYEHLEVS